MNFETLYILFKIESEKLQQKLNEVDSKLDKTKKHMKETDASSNALEKSFMNLAKGIGSFIAAAVSVHAVLSGFKTAADFSIQLSQQSQQMGVNVTELQRWGQAVESQGGSAQGFKSSLEGLAKTFNITAGEAIRLLPSLANVFPHLNKFQALNYGHSLGLDDATINFLQKGNGEISKLLSLQSKLGLLTEKDAENFRMLSTNMVNSKNALNGLFTALLKESLPFLNKALDVMTTIFVSLQHHTGLFKGALIGLTAAIVGFGRKSIIAVATNPFLAMIAGVGILISLLGLLFDDLDKYSKGEDSLVGRIEKKWPTAIQALKNSVKLLLDTFEALSTALETIFGWLEKFNTFETQRSGTVNEISQGWKESLGNTAKYLPINTQTSSVIDNSNKNSTSAFNQNNTLNSNITLQTPEQGSGNLLKKQVQDSLSKQFTSFQNMVATGTK